ncbi:MAG: helix-hairpin-helix domain-containing protein [Acidobacteriota bacterium]|jgi:putative hydrolase
MATTGSDQESADRRERGDGASGINRDVAERLREAAALLDQQDANPFRVRAYRRAADNVEQLDRGVDEILSHDGIEGLLRLPGIGSGIGGAIEEMARSGRWSLLERLRGHLEPERLFQTIPGLGPELAERIHDRLDIDTLEGLEIAAHDGRLEKVDGIGPRRAAMVRAELESRLGRRSRERSRRRRQQRPDVRTLLAVDREYRDGAATDRLPRIAPRRFNPEGKEWLPILHTEHDGWHFTALFSNTARAHQLGRTDDWVVIYFYDDDHEEGQCTVVTETSGPLEGQRVVRGRETECRALSA